RGGGVRRLATPVLIVAVAVVLIALPIGPTAAWRHAGIGAGRSLLDSSNANSLTRSILETRRYTRWEQDGRESSVGLQMLSGVAFIVNGKNDGNARFDASTQVMLGLTSAIFHPAPRSAFVVGMGTGSSAGALAAVETVERVDVAELEPATLEMARRCGAVNFNAMDQAKVHVIVGDARELLLTIPRTYDLIVSEPSNPYRAGVASLYTREFYEAVKTRLEPGGIFSQWVQAYEIDGATFRTIYATLASVFPYVETWQTNDLDLLMLASQDPFAYDADALRRRIQTEPFRSALLNTWNVIDLEGVFSHYAANSAFPAAATRDVGARLNTDDQTLIEFQFARTVGQDLTFTPDELRNTAFDHGMFRPQTLRGEVDWVEVEEQRMHIATLMEHKISKRELLSEPVRRRAEAFANFIDGDLAAVFEEWSAQPRKPKYPLELIVAGEAAAEAGDVEALTFAEALAQYMPVDATIIRARYLFRTGQAAPAARALADGFIALRTDPWPNSLVVERALKLAQEMAKKGPEIASVLLEALSLPYAVYIYEDLRMEMAVDVASNISPATAVPYIEAYEPNPIWTREFLAYREFAYRDTGHPLAKRALRDLAAFSRALSKGLSEIIGGPAAVD
ncbi:MAG: fused MFS/spermidine synthase, partial [Candidatus Hydrogenedentota bacterium]